MPLNLGNIGNSLATNPFLNPLGSLVNQTKTKKELEALKAAQAAQANQTPLYDFSSTNSGTAPSAPASSGMPPWAIVTVSLLGIGAVVTIIVVIAKRLNK